MGLMAWLVVCEGSSNLILVVEVVVG